MSGAAEPEGASTAARRTARPLFAAAALFSALGALAIVLPGVLGATIDVLVGWLLVSAGLVGLTIAKDLPGRSGWRGAGWTFGLSILAGSLLVIYPFAEVKAVVAPLVVLFTIEGVAVTRLGLRLRRRLPVGIWLAFDGASSIAIAGLIVLGWPETARWAIGALVGVNLLTKGLALAMMGLDSRRRSASVP